MTRRSHFTALLSLTFAACLPAASKADDLPPDSAAIALFSTAFANECMGAFQEDGTLIEAPQRFEVASPRTLDDPVTMVVWEFNCEIFAYNTSQVFLVSTDQDGVLPVALARPTLKMEYDEEAEKPGEANSVVKLLEIDGWSADQVLINASFDPATLSISAFTFWRGLGDASDAGIWQLQDRQFRLRHYEVDASYDLQGNPVLLVDFK